jgi:hypothetical protein
MNEAEIRQMTAQICRECLSPARGLVSPALIALARDALLLRLFGQDIPSPSELTDVFLLIGRILRDHRQVVCFEVNKGSFYHRQDIMDEAREELGRLKEEDAIRKKHRNHPVHSTAEKYLTLAEDAAMNWAEISVVVGVDATAIEETVMEYQRDYLSRDTNQ